MYKIFRLIAIAFPLMLVSCGPTYFSLGVDMRLPSRSGIVLTGKNMSVTYLDNGTDSLFMSSVAEGFAQALEKDYYSGEQNIGIYSIKDKAGTEYASRDSMVSLLMDTGVDVAFLFDLESMGKPVDSVSDIPFEIRLYVYDAMNHEDVVQMYEGTSSLKQDADMAEQGIETGKRSANAFVSSWTNRRFIFFYYQSDPWYTAAEYASDYKFKEAMDVWMTLLDTNNLYKRSCAEYNIAAACCIMGEKELATQWLDRSDSDHKLSESASLRSKIKSLP